MLRLLESKSATAAPPRQTKPDTKWLNVGFAVKADSVDEDARTFEGLAATWDLDLGGDVIHQGAFKRTLKFWRDSGRVMPLLDSHNYSVRDVVGKLLEARETDEGLWTKWQVIEGGDGDEVWLRLKGGYVTGLSIGYRAIKVDYATEEEEREGIWRHLKEVELREVSVVLWPMNPEARVDTETVKHMLASYQGRELSEEERAELKALQQKISALLKAVPTKEPEDPPAPEPASEDDDDGGEPKGLAPDDPLRLDLESRMRAIRVRRLTSRASA